MNNTIPKEDLVAFINAAFEDVQLGEGIGLWRGQGIDDYADSVTMRQLATKDKVQGDNWNLVSYEDLNICESSMSFMDAEGLRYYLPQLLLFAMDGPTDVAGK